MSSWQPPRPATEASAEELDELAAVRSDLNELIRWQRASILYFDRQDVADDDTAGPGSFFQTLEERAADAPATGSRLTTTVTCIESLAEMPDWLSNATGDERAKPSLLLSRLEHYMSRHLSSPDVAQVWRSDEAAWVYCRVRALGAYLRVSDAVTEPQYEFRTQLRDRVAEAWRSRFDGGASFGLREAALDVSSEAFRGRPQREATDQQYPPNAYLTYWGLLARRGLIRAEVELPQGDGDLSERQDRAARDWLADTLARQVSYHYNDSALVDPQQLLWSICGLVRFADNGENSSHSARQAGRFDNVRSPAHELLVAGLKAFFAQMQPTGDWAIGAPLFHFKNAGNAYSYIYEALGELFSVACAGPAEVDQSATAALRRELRPHWSSIKTLLARARELGQELDDRQVVVWSSGHHPHRSAESWATASVFRMLQSLRRIIGIWCAEETKQYLGARRPRKGTSELAQVGETWNTGHGTVGQYLRLAFLWSIERQEQERERAPVQRLFCIDPDQPILGEHQARSAILFGPPGTGKTTMVEALAGALGWQFLEVTPARFIDHGMDRVSAQADHIFRRIMELDRCVVLLDEIDELIQLRGAQSDPLERFFTTTMLPRLAKLWELGRVLFFVNTNDIERVDTAIRRAQRFDAALLVLPPGYESKSNELRERHQIDSPLSFDEVEREIALVDPSRAPQHERAEIKVNPGWFALMRFDQISTFASRYKEKREANRNGLDQPDRAAAADALEKVAKELLRLDWLVPDEALKNGEDASEPDLMKLPVLLGRLLGSERRDGRRQLVWRVSDGTYQAVPPGTDDPEGWATEAGYVIDPETKQLVRPSDEAAAQQPSAEDDRSVAPSATSAE